jgi:hypothetical protein
MSKSKPNVPAAMVKLHKASMDCVKHLVINKGYTVKTAEDMVLTTLQESADYIQNGLIDETIAVLKMTYMDQSPEQAAVDILKKVFK